MQTVLIRTALFVPGNRKDRIEKALNTEADAIIIDLEDAVPSSQKEACRSDVREKIESHPDRTILVRVNPLGSPFLGGDLEQVVVRGLSGIVLPKVEKAGHIIEIHELLCREEEKKKIGEGAVLLFPLIESAIGVQHVYDIVSVKTSPPRTYTVMFGAADYTLDMGLEMTSEGNELFYARSRICLACRAAGLAPPIDTPFMIDIKDTEALVADARRAKDLGFQGKMTIHPAQVDPCNRIFSPSPEETARAEKIVRAFEEAESAGLGAIQLDGKFIDYPVVKRAREVMALASAIKEKK